MAFESRNSNQSFAHGIGAGESVAEQRARIAEEAAQREERRQADLAEQSSIRNAPGERIRIWERMHGLSLPRDPQHNLLAVIALSTDLEIEQVQEEQRLRLRGPVTPV